MKNIKRPVLPVKTPLDLTKVENGKLADGLLRKVHNHQGRLYRQAAAAYNAMSMAAFFDGVPVVPVSVADCYRTFVQQESTFLRRYTTSNNGAKVTRKYQDKTWYLIPGNAPSAAPGTSNHGLGLAVDINLTIDRRTFQWLLGDGFITCNALKYGFSWEGSGDPKNPNHEDWHLRYVCGDDTPQAVAEALAAFPELDVR